MVQTLLKNILREVGNRPTYRIPGILREVAKYHKYINIRIGR